MDGTINISHEKRYIGWTYTVENPKVKSVYDVEYGQGNMLLEINEMESWICSDILN